MTARDRLDGALVNLAAAGRRPVCGEPWSEALWTSDDADDRAEAARLCQRCPLLEPCAAAADEADERHHVWGGIDRSKRATPRTRPGADALDQETEQAPARPATTTKENHR